MDLQIRKLVVWAKEARYAPRVIQFELNKVNVITGASRTGKSAIIPIIDYCLGSKSCSIPIDTIRDHASWYGVVLSGKDEEVLIARRVPEGNKSSNDFYLTRAKNITLPTVIDERNQSLEDVKLALNEIASLPYIGFDEDDDNRSGFKARLSFRDLMAFVFQTQDIVANQNILFYKTHAHEHREKLRVWFPFILGAESIEVLKARQRLNVLERKLATLRRENEKEKAISEQWKSNIFGHLRTAEDYGILQEQFSENDDPETLLEIGRSLIQANPDSPNISSDIVNNTNNEIFQVEQESTRLARELASIRKRLDEVRKLKQGFSGYGSVVRKRANRLHISRWLEDVANESSHCPVCGEVGHGNAQAEMAKISSVLRTYEEQASESPPVC